MDQDTGAALYDHLMTKSHEALAIEVVTMRAWYGSLATAMDELTAHIAHINAEDIRPEAKARCAGGIAAIQLLRDWTDQSMGTINDFITTMAEVD